jgi:hypothetical protein
MGEAGRLGAFAATALAVAAALAGCSTGSEGGGGERTPPAPTGGAGADASAPAAPDGGGAAGAPEDAEPPDAPAEAGEADAAVPSCAGDPLACPAGKTCWSTDEAGGFACIASGKSKQGEPCASWIGKASCADGLVCFSPTDPAKGTCAPFCDPKHPCSGDEICTTLVFSGGGQIDACIVPPPDAGAEAGAEGGDAATQ